MICAFISSSYIIAYSEVFGGNISHPNISLLKIKKVCRPIFIAVTLKNNRPIKELSLPDTVNASLALKRKQGKGLKRSPGQVKNSFQVPLEMHI